MHLQEKIRFSKELIKPIAILSGIYLVSLLALFRANYYYNDDLARSLTGMKGWADTDKRYISSFLSPFIHTSRRLADISPLTQLIAIVLCAVAAVLLIYVFTQRKKISTIELFAVVPLAINPFFLQCLSYKFDSPYMALSILACVFPLLWIDNKKWLTYAIISFLCLLCVCNTYQVSVCLYPMFVFAKGFQEWNQGKDMKSCLRSFAVSACSFATALIAYEIVFVKGLFIFNTDNEFIAQILPLQEIFKGYFLNLNSYYVLAFQKSNLIWLILSFGIGIVFVISSIIGSERSKWKSLIGSILLLIVLLLVCLFPYPAFANARYTAREMYPICILFVILGLLSLGGGMRRLTILVCSILSWCYISFAFLYGNALAEQKNYNDFRIQMLIQDINQLEDLWDEDEVYCQFEGEVYSPVIENMPFPIVKFLIPETFSGWGQYYFENYFGLTNIRSVYDTDCPDIKELHLPKVVDNGYYTINYANEYMLVTFKR